MQPSHTGIQEAIYLKLDYLYQVINGNFVLPSAPLVRHTLPPGLRNAGSVQFQRPIRSTNAHLFSFLPHAISKWNARPGLYLKKFSLRTHYHHSSTTWNLIYFKHVTIVLSVCFVYYFCSGYTTLLA